MQATNYTLLILTITLLGCSPASDQEAIDGAHVEPTGIIAFTSSQDGNAEIYTIHPDGSETRRITNHPALDFHTDWSPDGQTVAFYSRRNGNSDIYLVGRDGSNLRQITTDTSNEVLPLISPDNSRIVFVSDKGGESRNVFLMDIDGNNLQQVTNNTLYEESPSWAPDGNALLFTRQIKEEGDTSHAANGEIFRIDLRTQEETRLTNKPGFDSGAKYSPDGSQIAFYGLEHELWNIYLMQADGSNLNNLTSDSTECYSPDWSPDGNWITYTAGNSENYEIWIINVHSREKRRVTNSPGRDEKPAWGVTMKNDQ